MTRWAVILDIAKDVPTFHAYAPVVYADGELHQFTRCGRIVSDKRVGIPSRHARKFAKECRGCFPPQA